MSSDVGPPASLLLVPPTNRRYGNLLEVVRHLRRGGYGLRAAKVVIDRLLLGQSAFVALAHVDNLEAVRRDMAKHGIEARPIESRPVDVQALRARLGYSQEEFAGRFGLDVATLRNWEQGRTTPDGPARTLLQLIDRDPDAVTAMLAA